MKKASVNSVKLIHARVPDAKRGWQKVFGTDAAGTRNTGQGTRCQFHFALYNSRVLRPLMLVLALAAAWEARAQEELPRIRGALPGFGGQFRNRHWAPLRVEVENPGPARTGLRRQGQQGLSHGLLG